MNRESKKVTLISAGLNGSLLGILLVQRRFSVEIYERRPDMRRVQISAGRSINLAISTQEVHALQQARLWKKCAASLYEIRGRVMHSPAGELCPFQPYGKIESEVINSISRAELNVPLGIRRKTGGDDHFERRCTGYDFESGTLRLRHEDSGKETAAESEVVMRVRWIGVRAAH